VQDLLRMERVLLDGLSWRIKTPTTYTFLHLFTQTTAVLRAAAATAAAASKAVAPPACSQQHPQQHQQQPSPAASCEPMQGSVVAKAAYLTELALLDYSCLAFKPSQLAAAALLVAQSWSEQGAAGAAQEMQHVSGGCLGCCLLRCVCLCRCGTL
jgi:hypothetical protein